MRGNRLLFLVICLLFLVISLLLLFAGLFAFKEYIETRDMHRRQEFTEYLGRPWPREGAMRKCRFDSREDAAAYLGRGGGL